MFRKATFMALMLCLALVIPGSLAQEGGSELVIGHHQTPSDFNPLATIQGVQQLYARYVFSKLVTFTPAGPDQELIGDLAESWTFSEDGTEFTFALREGVTWQDGEPFTAEDVVFTFEYLLSPDSGATNLVNFATIVGAEALSSGETDTLEGVVANGDYEVTFTLTEPSAVFLVNLASQFIIPEHVVSEIPPAEFATSEFATSMPYPGTGPYVFVRNVTDQFFELAANENYFRGVPNIETITVQSIPDANTRIIALENGEIDIATSVPSDELARVEGTEGITVVRRPGTYTGIFIDSDQSKDDPMKVAMRTPQFRQALLKALDFDVIINEVSEGTLERIGCIVKTEWACGSDTTELYPYDPDAARALLEEIGWDSSWEIDWMILASQLGPIHAVVQAMWQEVGVTTAPRAVDGPTFIDAFYSTGDFDITLVGYGTSNDPHTTANSYFVCGQTYPNGYNGPRYCNDRVTELVNAGATTVDQTEREAIYQELTTILQEDLPLIPVWMPPSLTGVGPDVVTYTYSNYNWDSIETWEMAE